MKSLPGLVFIDFHVWFVYNNFCKSEPLSVSLESAFTLPNIIHVLDVARKIEKSNESQEIENSEEGEGLFF